MAEKSTFGQFLNSHPHWRGKLLAEGIWPQAPLVAVVGTRKPTAEQWQRAHWLGGQLAERGVGVVSGGAVGIDAAALAGALRAGGPAVAVLPCRPQTPFPKQNGELFAQVLRQGGALIGLDVASPMQWHFLQRNRALAELVQGLIAVAGEMRSGTLQAARSAVQAGDTVAVCRWAPHTPGSEGTAWLADHGVPAIADGADLAAWLAATTGDRSNRAAAPHWPRSAAGDGPGRKAVSVGARGSKPPHGVDERGRHSPSYRAAAGATAAAVQRHPPASWPAETAQIWRILCLRAEAQQGASAECLQAESGLPRAVVQSSLLQMALDGWAATASDGSWIVQSNA